MRDFYSMIHSLKRSNHHLVARESLTFSANESLLNSSGWTKPTWPVPIPIPYSSVMFKMSLLSAQWTWRHELYFLFSHISLFPLSSPCASLSILGEREHDAKMQARETWTHMGCAQCRAASSPILLWANQHTFLAVLTHNPRLSGRFVTSAELPGAQMTQAAVTDDRAFKYFMFFVTVYN